jgi:hypothetical protein
MMVAKTVDITDLCGVFKPKVRKVSVEAMNDAIRRHASKQVIDSPKQERSPRSDRRR